MLDLHAAALVAVLAEAGTGTVRVDIRTVLSELLRHEQHLWYHSARAAGLSKGPDGMSPLMLRQVVAAGCLLGAATEQEARALPGRVPGLSPSIRVARWLRDLPERTVRDKWREWGLPAYRIGKHLRWRERDVYAWIDRQAA